jgi:predicted GNAT superfamily acetyltransferase
VEQRYSFRDLATIAEFRSVFALEQAIWELPNGDDAVPVNLFAASVPHGAILVGAFDERAQLVGFVYSFPAFAGGRVIQWSHMLGVDRAHRGRGLGRRLKLAQRERALAQGVDLVAWTFDPLQDVNAAFNLNALGGEATRYLEDVYGASESPLHAGAPTDRLVVEWRLRSERVQALAAAAEPIASPAPPAGHVEGVQRVSREAGWTAPAGQPDLASSAPRVGIPVPGRFTAMLRERPDLACRWRDATRQAFGAYFARGYRAVHFDQGDEGGGSYRLVAPGT